jgi:hypothetical protein
MKPHKQRLSFILTKHQSFLPSPSPDAPQPQLWVGLDLGDKKHSFALQDRYSQSEEGTLDRHRCLSARRYFEETPAPEFQPLHYFTDFEPHPFRENVHFTGSFSTAAHIPNDRREKSPMFTGFLNRIVVILPKLPPENLHFYGGFCPRKSRLLIAGHFCRRLR